MPTSAERTALYFDSSALVKLVVKERESSVLRAWLGRRVGMEHISSSLSRTEMARAVRAHDLDVRLSVVDRLRKTTIVGVTDRLLDEAGRLPPELLRSLDAIHLATAREVGTRLQAVVTYDHRMIDGARSIGLPVAHPGAGLG